jgi:hypothetical protein
MRRECVAEAMGVRNERRNVLVSRRLPVAEMKSVRAACELGSRVAG